MDRTANNQSSLLQEADELCMKKNFKEAAGKYEEFLQKQDNHLALVKLAECNF